MQKLYEQKYPIANLWKNSADDKLYGDKLVMIKWSVATSELQACWLQALRTLHSTGVALA